MLFRSSIKPFAILSVLAGLGALVAAAAGLFAPNFYPLTGGLLTGAWAQDVIALVAGALLLIVAPAARRGSARAVAVWGGCLGYLIYGYLLYTFDAVYTALFPLYIAILGLSVYSLIGLLTRLDPAAFRARVGERAPARFMAVVLAIPLLLIPVWVMFVLQGVAAGAPAAINSVLVIDLSFVIPACLLTAVLVWRRQTWGFLFAGLLLAKMTTMGVSLALATFWARAAFGTPVDPVQTPVYAAFAVLGGLALALFLRALSGADERRPALAV